MTPRLRRLRATLVPAAVLVLGAYCCCVPPVEPDGVAGTYRLAAVDADAPPATIWASDAGGGTQVLDASLRLAAPDDAVIEWQRRPVDSAGRTGATVEEVFAGTWAGGEEGLRIDLAAGRAARATAEVVSRSEVRVTLEVYLPASTGYGTYPPVRLTFRR